MWKAGIIAGVVMALLAFGAGVAIFVGLGAGYLAASNDRPAVQDAALKKGAVAGAVAGAMGAVGQVIAAVVNASLIDPEMLNALFGTDMLNETTLWMVQIGGGICIGLFNVLLMAGLGLAGAAIWNSMRNRQAPPPVIPGQYS
jgi:hypothetical protein